MIVDYTVCITSTRTDHISENNKENTKSTYQPSVRYKENANGHIHKLISTPLNSTEVFAWIDEPEEKKRLD
jgi:hypothetical protein